MALADVYTLLEDLKRLPLQDFNNAHFVYSMKVFYSLELMTNYLKEVSLACQGEAVTFNEYLSLLNHYVIPAYVMYDLQLQYPKRFSFTYRYDDKKVDSDKNVLYQDLISKISFSSQGIYGEITKGARPTYKDGDKQNKLVQRAYQYRTVFDINDLVPERQGKEPNDGPKRKNTWTYGYDLFGFIGRTPEVLNDMEEQLSVPYILLSIFDIDRFIFASYVRRSEDRPLKYFMDSINGILTASRATQMKRLILNAPPLKSNYVKLMNDGESVYRPVYSLEEIEQLENMDIVPKEAGKPNAKRIYNFTTIVSEEMLAQFIENVVDAPRQELIAFVEYVQKKSNIGETLSALLSSYQEKVKRRISKSHKSELQEILRKHSEEILRLLQGQQK